MKIVGCDLHTPYQQIAMLDDETSELIERRLEHAHGEAKEFYTSLRGQCGWGLSPPGTRAGSSSWWQSCDTLFVAARPYARIRGRSPNERDFHTHGWATGPWELKTPRPGSPSEMAIQRRDPAHPLLR